MVKRVPGEPPPDPAAMLPFYLNGSLSTEDRERFEAALSADPDLRADLEQERAAARLVRDHGDELAAGSEASTQARLEDLMARIDAEAVPPRAAARRATPFRASRGGGGLERGWFWRPAFAAAAVVVVVQAAILVSGVTSTNQYRGLSGPRSTSAPAGARLLVKLSPNARWGQVEALFSEQDLTIVGGPRDGALDVAAPAGAKAGEIARRLRSSTLIAFVAPES